MPALASRGLVPTGCPAMKVPDQARLVLGQFGLQQFPEQTVIAVPLPARGPKGRRNIFERSRDAEAFLPERVDPRRWSAQRSAQSVQNRSPGQEPALSLAQGAGGPVSSIVADENRSL